MLDLIYEMTLSDYHASKFPLWIANISGEKLMFEFICEDQECEGSEGACMVRIWRRMEKAA